MGAFSPSVLVAAWYSNNTPSESRRAVVAAVMGEFLFVVVSPRAQANQFELVAIANSSGLISTNVFREKDEPKYVLALAVSAAFGGLCLVLVAGVGIWMRWENARRNREQGVNITSKDVDTSEVHGPSHPSWRYVV